MDPSSVDLRLLKFSELKTLSNNGKTVYIMYGNDKLTIQTPQMRLPFGVNDYSELDAKQGKQPISDTGKRYDMNVEFTNYESDKEMRAFLDMMKSLEMALIDAVYANRMPWMRDNFDDDKKFVAKLFTPIIKYDKDKITGKIVGKYPPSIKVKLPYDTASNTFKFDAYDMNFNSIDFNDIMKNMRNGHCILQIQASSIWFAGGRFGVTWKVIQGAFEARKASNEQMLRSLKEAVENSRKKAAPIEDEDEEEALDDAIAAEHVISPLPEVISKMNKTQLSDSEDDEESAPPPKKATSNAKAKIQLSDSEDDEEAAEEEAAEESSEEDDPTPPPPPPKKKAASGTKAKK